MTPDLLSPVAADTPDGAHLQAVKGAANGSFAVAGVRPWAVSLRAILLTHAHWDHVSGLPDFPGVPVWVTRPEHAGRWQFGATLPGVHYEEYGFEDGPYLGFPASHDVYGDGAIVVVPAPATPPAA